MRNYLPRAKALGNYNQGIWNFLQCRLHNRLTGRIYADVQQFCLLRVCAVNNMEQEGTGFEYKESHLCLNRCMVMHASCGIYIITLR